MPSGSLFRPLPLPNPIPPAWVELYEDVCRFLDNEAAEMEPVEVPVEMEQVA